jgi:hypothetical protein
MNFAIRDLMLLGQLVDAMLGLYMYAQHVAIGDGEPVQGVLVVPEEYMRRTYNTMLLLGMPLEPWGQFPVQRIVDNTPKGGDDDGGN